MADQSYQSADPSYMTMQEVAKMFHLDAHYVYEFTRKEKFRKNVRSIKDGKFRLFKRDDVYNNYRPRRLRPKE